MPSRSAGSAPAGGPRARGLPRELPRSLPAQVARQLGIRILRGDYLPGEIIPNESELGREFGVSRSVLRESIKLLAAKGMIDTRPKRGTRVREAASWSLFDAEVLAWRLEAGVDTAFLQHLAEVRSLFESQAAALAAERASEEEVAAVEAAYQAMAEASEHEAQVAADLDFHYAVLKASGNPMMLSLAGAIWAALHLAFDVGGRQPEAWGMTLPRHHRVAEAIRARQPQEAFAAMLRVINDGAEDVRSALENSRPPRKTG